jgi:mycoredoxin
MLDLNRRHLVGKKLFVIVIFAGFFNWYFGKEKLTSSTEAYSNISLDSEYSVTLYATEWCGYCKKTRKFLAENNIDYQEYDIEKSEEGSRRYKALNGNGVPLVVVNREVIRGYNPKAIVAALSVE